MSIIDKSAVFSRSQAPRKSRSTKSSSAGGGVYELVGAKQKLAKKDDGGYVIPSKAHALAGGDGGYVLPSTGKNIFRQSMVLDDHSNLRDERCHKSKNSVTWIVGVVLLVTTALGMTAIFAYSVYTMISKVEPLPDLSEQCRYAQQPSVHQLCVYHRRKYPDNCSTTRCDTVLLKWSSDKMKLNIDNRGVSPLIGIEDRTPCQDGKWCMKGECVQTSDKTIEQYSSLQPVNGKWKNHCREPMCMDGTHRAEYHAKQCSKSLACPTPGVDDDPGRHVFQIGFRSCTDPFPSYDGEFCDNQKDDNIIYGAFYVARYCRPCDDSTVSQAHEECSLIPQTCKFVNESTCHDVDHGEHTKSFPSGHTCHSNDDQSRTDLCYFGLCLQNIKSLRDECA